MLKSDVTLNMEVVSRGKGRGMVADLEPTYRCYVKVIWNSGEEGLYDVDFLKPAPPPKKSKNTPRTFFQPTANQWAFMGWCAADAAFWMPTSVPETLFQEAWEEVEETQKSNPTGITTKSEGSIGVCYDMVLSKPSCDLEALGKTLGVRFKPFFNHENADRVLLYGSRKAWFFHFLRHGFKDGKGPRDVQAIRATVPPEHHHRFDAGTQGVFEL